MSVLKQAKLHSGDAEQTVIGCLLLDPDAIHNIVTKLQPTDFFDPIYRDIYAAICELYNNGTPIDFVTVANHLEGHDEIKKLGGSAFLAETTENVPTASHIESYANIILAKSKRRQLMSLGQNMLTLASDEEKTPDDLIAEAEQQLLKLSYANTSQKPIAFRDVQDARYDHYALVYEAADPTEHYGLQTGYVELDRRIVGLQPGHLMVIAGRPSMGKTALALDMARQLVEDQKHVTIFSLEMTKEQLCDRLIAAAHQVDEHQLSRGELSEQEMDSLGNTLDEIRNLPLFIDDDPDRNLANLRSKARRHKIEHGMDLLIIDYMQLI